MSEFERTDDLPAPAVGDETSSVTDGAADGDSTPVPEEPDVIAPQVNKWRHRWRLLKKHQLGVLGLMLLGFIAFTALIGPVIVNVDPNASDLSLRLAAPFTEVAGRVAWAGTDSLGRDVLARVFVGGRASLSVVLLALVLGAGTGTLLGMLAGFRGGWVDNVIMRIVDAQLALPTLVLAMLVAATLGTGFLNTAITLGFASWAVYARLIRGEVLKVREEEYVEAGIALGGGDSRILFRHVLPNVMSALLVVASLQLGRMVLVESTLSYLGFGLQPPNASWGSMIRQGQAFIQSAWWLSTVPGVLIAATVLGLNLVGDWLRDIFDPHVT